MSTIRTLSRARRVAAGLALSTMAIAACGGGDSTTTGSAQTTGTSPVTAAPSTADGTTVDDTTVENTTVDSAAVADTAVDTTGDDTTGDDSALDVDAPDLGRVVSLAEEFILADLLSLGIEPVASTATVDTVGFQGLDEFDTSAIEVLPQTTLNLEYLASLQPDTIVTLQFWVDQVGDGVLEGIADVVIIPDGLSGAERIEALGDLVGRPEHAAKVAAEVDRAQQAAIDQVPDGCEISLAVVYPGPTIAAFVDGPWELPSAFQAVGCELVPGPDVAAPDANGRAFLSEEQLGLLAAPTLVLMQNDTVDGETAALDQVSSGAIWQTIPAVAAGHVVIIDRLGYPGAQGLIRFYSEVAGMLAAAGS